MSYQCTLGIMFMTAVASGCQFGGMAPQESPLDLYRNAPAAVPAQPVAQPYAPPPAPSAASMDAEFDALRRLASSSEYANDRLRKRLEWMEEEREKDRERLREAKREISSMRTELDQTKVEVKNWEAALASLRAEIQRREDSHLKALDDMTKHLDALIDQAHQSPAASLEQMSHQVSRGEDEERGTWKSNGHR